MLPEIMQLSTLNVNFLLKSWSRARQTSGLRGLFVSFSSELLGLPTGASHKMAVQCCEPGAK